MLLGLIALCVGLAQNYYTVALIGMYVHPNTSYIHALILIYSYMHARMLVHTYIHTSIHTYTHTLTHKHLFHHVYTHIPQCTLTYVQLCVGSGE